MQVINYIILGASFVTAVTTICAFLKKVINKGFEPLNKKIDLLDESHCKNYLVNFLKDKEKGEKIDEVIEQRAYEIYDHYTKDLNGNSYIHDKWEKLMK